MFLRLLLILQKPEIKKAVESFLKLKVKSVNTLNQKGKKKDLEVKLAQETILKKHLLNLPKAKQ